MNFKPLASVLAVSGLLIAGIANAGTFSQSPDPGSVVRGGSASNVDFLFAGDGLTEDAQLDITLSDVTDLTITPSILVPGSVCVLVDADTLRIVPPSGAGVPLTSTATAYCRFAFTATAGATTGLRTWTTDFIECASPTGPAGSCTFGGTGVNITDAPPDVTLSYDPTPGTTVNFTGGTGVAGSTSTASITATAGGTNGTATVTACGFSGGNPGAFALTSGDLSIAAGASDTIDMTCTRALTAQSSTLTCTENDSDSTNTPRSWPVSCPVGTPVPTPEYTSVPSPGGTIDCSGAPATTTTGTLTITNTGITGTGSDLTYSCTEPPTANFTITSGGSGTVTVGNTAQVQIQCLTPAAAGDPDNTDVLDCTTNDTGGTDGVDESAVSYDLVAGVLVGLPPEREASVIPVSSLWSKLMLIGLLLGLGGVALSLRRH